MGNLFNIFLATTDWGTTAIIIAFGVFLLGMMLWQGSRQKKAQADFMSMLDTLRTGMRVKMASGVIGRIKIIREEAPGFKTVLIETGDDKNNSTLVYDINAVQGIINEDAIMQLNIKKNLEELEKADAERKASDGVSVAENNDNTDTIKVTTLNGEEFDAEKYVAKRNASVKKTADKTTATKSKTKK
jgi:preprotein translocase subunit YajC